MNATIVLLLATAQAAETTATPPAEPAAAAASSEGGRAEPERWSSFLPLMADEARKRGVDLPLPFGASLVYTHLERDIRVTDVRIGQGGSPPTSVSELAQFSSTSRVDNLNLKPARAPALRALHRGRGRLPRRVVLRPRAGRAALTADVRGRPGAPDHPSDALGPVNASEPAPEPAGKREGPASPPGPSRRLSCRHQYPNTRPTMPDSVCRSCSRPAVAVVYV
jgi:hypothetical protein